MGDEEERHDQGREPEGVPLEAHFRRKGDLGGPEESDEDVVAPLEPPRTPGVLWLPTTTHRRFACHPPGFGVSLSRICASVSQVNVYGVLGNGNWGMGDVKGFGWGSAEDRDLKVAPTMSYRLPIEAPGLLWEPSLTAKRAFTARPLFQIQG